MKTDATSAIAELARAIGALASGDHETGNAIIVALAKTVERSAQQVLPGMPAPPPSINAEESRRAAAKRLFAYWQAQCSHQQAKLTPERAAKILARLRDGYSEAEIRKAIDGAASAAFTNAEGKTFDDIELVCRNGVKLEDFMARGIKATGEVIQETSDVVTSGGIEEKIQAMRRTMSLLKAQGRDLEYQRAAEDLGKLLTTRAATRAA